MIAGILVVVFVVVPIVEIAVIIQVGSAIGVVPTIVLLIGISVLGAWLAKHEGFVVLARTRRQLEAGRIPSNELIDGVLVLAGGILLLTPGFITDIVGLVLLFPVTRAGIRAFVRRRLRLSVFYPRVGWRGRDPGPGPGSPPDDVIDV
jgi:UPF0716 protein FxsA